MLQIFEGEKIGQKHQSKNDAAKKPCYNQTSLISRQQTPAGNYVMRRFSNLLDRKRQAPTKRKERK